MSYKQKIVKLHKEGKIDDRAIVKMAAFEEEIEKLYNSTPEIKKYDKKIAREYFDSIVHHSPRIATDPVAAKSYLANMLMWEGSSSGVPVNHFLDMAQITSKNPTPGSYFVGRGGLSNSQPVNESFRFGMGKAFPNKIISNSSKK